MVQRQRKSSILSPDNTHDSYTNAMTSLFRRVRWRGSLILSVWILISLWLLHITFRSGDSSGSSRKPMVQLRQGKIIGTKVKTGFPQVLEQFLGVPYALST